MTENASDALISWLATLDPGGRATLRHSLAFPPGQWPAAFPYVEPFVRGKRDWARSATYLLAGLLASSRATAPSGDLGDAAFRLREKTDSRSVEARFIALLDADSDQLAHRLRQMITLMSGHDIAPDWSLLRRHLVGWNHPERYVQQKWAESYFARDARGTAEDSTGSQGPRETKPAEFNINAAKANPTGIGGDAETLA